METPTNGSLRVPGWFVTAVVLTAAVFSAGWAAAQRSQSKDNDVHSMQLQFQLEFQTISTRLCRLERSQHIEPWATCNPDKP